MPNYDSTGAISIALLNRVWDILVSAAHGSALTWGLPLSLIALASLSAYLLLVASLTYWFIFEVSHRYKQLQSCSVRKCNRHTSNLGLPLRFCCIRGIHYLSGQSCPILSQSSIMKLARSYLGSQTFSVFRRTHIMKTSMEALQQNLDLYRSVQHPGFSKFI